MIFLFIIQKTVFYFEQTTDYVHVNLNQLWMTSKLLSMLALFAISTMIIPLAHASSPTQISLTSYGNTEIDLSWDESKQTLSTWTSVSNFDPTDKSFTMQIIQTETGKVVAETPIIVVANNQQSSLDFNIFVKYQVNAEDICQNEKFDPSTMSWQECNPLTGKYEMQVSANDGSTVDSTVFTITDTRA